MKLEVGMYVRNNYFGIGKIVSKYKDNNDKTWYNVNFRCYEDTEGHCGICEQTIGFKASHNIIDLIEVGDYVNGGKVSRIENDYIVINEIWTGRESLNNEEIKTILTKEHFENNCYKIGD